MELYIAPIIVIISVIYFLSHRKKKQISKEETSTEPVKTDESKTESQAETEFPVYWFDESGNKVEGVAKMARGIQIFDESGNCIIDLTNKLTRILGSGRTNGTSGSLSDSNIQGNNCWAIATTSYTTDIAIPPQFSTSNGVLSWTYPGYSGKFPYTVKKLDCDFIYGTY